MKYTTYTCRDLLNHCVQCSVGEKIQNVTYNCPPKHTCTYLGMIEQAEATRCSLMDAERCVACCQLVWTVVEPRHVHTLESQSHCEWCLCDNRWHSVHGVMADGRLSLRVDASTSTDQLVSTSLDLRQELFIGGFSGTSPAS